MTPPMTPTPAVSAKEKARETVRAALEAELGDAYDCKRVWEAWHVGTMAEDDFEPVSDRLDEIAETVLAALSATEGEAEPVAIGWLDESDLAILSRIRGQTGACRITAIKAHAGPGYLPLYASPPSAPAGVKAMRDALETAVRLNQNAKRGKADGRVFIDYRDWEAFMAEVRSSLHPDTQAAAASAPAGEDGPQKAEIARWKRDSELLGAIQDECWDVRFTSTPNADAGDYNVNIEIVGHFMAEPQERVVGENYNENLRAALEQAMTAEAYPPAHPVYNESADLSSAPAQEGRS